MHILVLTDRFHPEITAPSVRILDHARHWLAAGHRVTVVTGAPNFPKGEVFPGYRNELWGRETIEGVEVIRLPSYMAENAGFAKRLADYGSLAAAQILAAPFFPDDIDVVLATSPPLHTAVAGAMVAKVRRLPWVFEVRDLWPASIKAVGAADGPVLDVLEALELRLYRSADRVVLLTRSFHEDLVSRGILAHKLDVVTNAVDLERFVADPETTARARSELGVPEGVFLAGYIGTTGMAHGLQTVVDAAALTRDRDDIRWLIMGQGAARAELEARVKELRLPNVIFHDFVPHAEVPSWIAALDASLVHLRPDPLFHTVIPSKIFECMAVGTPIVMAVEGESAAIVEEAGAGVCLPSGDARRMAEVVSELAVDAERCEGIGASGRRAVERTHNRASRAAAMIEAMERAVASHRR